MTRDQAIDVARRNALRHGRSEAPQTPNYLPRSPRDAATFRPHDWVIDSILCGAGFETSLPIDAALRVEAANQYRTTEECKAALSLDDTETLALFVLALRGKQ